MASKPRIKKRIQLKEEGPKVVPFGLMPSFQLHLQGIDYNGAIHNLFFGKGPATLFKRYPDFLKNSDELFVYGKVLHESFQDSYKKESKGPFEQDVKENA